MSAEIQQLTSSIMFLITLGVGSALPLKTLSFLNSQSFQAVRITEVLNTLRLDLATDFLLASHQSRNTDRVPFFLEMRIFY